LGVRIGRRAFLWGAATAAVGLGGYGALRFGRRRKLIPAVESTPSADRFRMPGEFEPQEAVWLVWPEASSWRLEGEPAQEVVVELAAAIADDIPVRLAVTPSQAARARSMLTGSVEVVEITAGTGWIRDDGPTFLINGDGARRGVDWDFNNWGYAGQNRFSKNFASYFENDSNEAAQRLLEYEGAECYRAPLVLEGGSIHTDGLGTVITTEECLLNPNRNPHLQKEEIEEYLKSYLGAKKIIWLPFGVYKDVTSGHVDNMCCFVKPSEVILNWTDDPNDAQYERSQQALEILEASTDASGAHFTVNKLHQPGPLHYTEQEIASFPSWFAEEMDWSEGRLAGSYVNYILTNRRVIFPLLDPEYDRSASETLARAFPKHEIVGLESREILLNGGDLHCISQQVPARA
jgi:agmatine deiminase